MTTLAMELTEDRAVIAEWVRAAQSGDRSAFGRLAERFEPLVLRLALRRLGNHAEAQELVQEVFVQVMRKIDQLRDVDRFEGWLRSVTKRMAINRAVRRRPVVGAENETLESSCAHRDTPLDQAIARERALRVRAGLGRLRELDRDTLVAFYVDGRSLVEMSADFASPVGTIKRRLHVARKRLAETLSIESL